MALLCADGPELAVALLTIAASATCAPLDPAHRVSEYESCLSDLRVSALLVQSDLESPARTAAQQHGILVIDLEPDQEAKAGLFTVRGAPYCESAEVIDGEFAAGSDAAIVLHTSGTTERPKRVPLTQINLCLGARNTAAAFALTDRDRCLNLMPLYHGAGIQTTLAVLASGGSVICPAFHDANAVFAWLEEFRPSWYSATPAVHHAVLSRAQEHRSAISAVPLRFIRSGAGALPPKIVEGIEQTFRAPVIETYGMTETGHICCSPMPPHPRKPGSVGLTMGLDVAIMDEAGVLVPPGTIGEVVVCGPTVTSGYEDHPEANTAAFRGGWFRTGDLGLLDGEGYLSLKGRLKDVINRGGEKVSPHEVESALLAHPDIVQGVVFPQPHTTLGEEVAAAIVLRDHAGATEQDVRRWVAARVADFKVPRRIIAVREIPQETSGKVRRSQLAEHFAPQLRVPYRTPETPLEAALAQIWSEELRVTGVGLHDNFFDLGGDSLSASRMCVRVEEDVTGRPISVATLLQAPTVAELACVLREAKPTSLSGACLVPIRPGGSRPPLFCLHGTTGFVVGYSPLAQHLGPDQPVYGLQAPWVDGPLPSEVRFEDLASQHVQQIRAFFPQGPYLLCGHSVAGLLAWEVAQQLREQGQRVALFTLLDTYLYNHPALAPKPASGVEHLRRRVEFHLDKLRSLSIQHRLAYVPRRLGARLRRGAAAAPWGAAGPPPAFGEFSWLDAWPPLWRMVITAGIAYLPRPYPGPIAVFLAQEREQDWDPGRDTRRPGSLATGPVEIYRVPGNHATLVKEPHVRILAKKLRDCLDRAVGANHRGSPSSLRLAKRR